MLQNWGADLFLSLTRAGGGLRPVCVGADETEVRQPC